MLNLITRFLPNLVPGLTAFLNPWVLVAVMLYGAGMLFYGIHISAWRLEAFQAKVAAAGEAQNARTVAKTIADKQRKTEADDENKTTRAALAIALDGLRASNPSGSFVPAAPAGASRPDLACFDRAEYIRADGKFTEGARGLADEGTAATVDLNTAKKWAKPLNKGN